jgi:hypothetical protein
LKTILTATKFITDNTITIQADENVVKVFLEFLYTGDIGDWSTKLNLDDAVATFELAHYFQSPALMNIAADIVGKRLTPEKALSIFHSINTLADFGNPKHTTSKTPDPDQKGAAEKQCDQKHLAEKDKTGVSTGSTVATAIVVYDGKIPLDSGLDNSDGVVEECRKAAISLREIISTFVAQNANQHLSTMISDLSTNWQRNVKPKISHTTPSSL